MSDVYIQSLNCRETRGDAYPYPGLAPRGAFRCCAPPNDCLCPPERGLCPEEISWLRATGVEIEAQIDVCDWYFRNFCWNDTGFQDIFGMKTFLFVGDHLFSAGKSLRISVKTFFFGNHLLSAEKSV